MKKNLFLRILILIVITFVLMCVGISFFWNPMKIKYDVPEENDLVETIHPNADLATNNIEIEDDGTFLLAGEDAYFELRDLQNGGRTIAIYYTEKPEERISYATTLDYGDGFIETQDKVIYSVSLRDADCVCIDLPDAEYTSVRIRPAKDIKVKAIEVHENEHTAYYKGVPHAKRNLMLGILVGVLFVIGFYLLDRRYLLTNLMAEFLIENKGYILQDAVASVLAIALSLFLSEIIYHGRYSFVYNVMIIAVALSVFVGIRHLLIKDYPTERTAFELVIFVGVCMLFSCGPHVSWDPFMHYGESIQSTRLFGEVALTDAESALMLNGGVPSGRTLSEVIRYFNDMTDGYKDWITASFSLKRIPAAIAINLVNLFGFFGYNAYFAGRFGQLITYALCVYFGIKRLHSGKMIYAVVAAFPVNIFLATNLSYDYVVTGFLMLGMAYFVGMCQEKEETVKTGDVIVMLLAFVVGCRAKTVYLPILVFPFLMSREKTRENKKYYAYCVCAFVLVLLFLLKDSLYQIQVGGDTRLGAGEVDPMGQLSYILEHPMTYARQLVDYLLFMFNPSRVNIGTRLGYLGDGPGYKLIMILLAIVTLFDKNEYDTKAYSPWIKGYSVLHFIGVSAIVTTALYMAFSPVGSDYMDGAQPRYYVSVFYPLCAVLCGRGMQIKKYIPEKLFETTILVIIFAINYLNIYRLAFLTAI